MSGLVARDTPQRLRDIREGLDALLVACEDNLEALGGIDMIYQMVDNWETLGLGEIDAQKLSHLEALIQSIHTSAVNITLHQEGLAYLEKFRRSGDYYVLGQAIASLQRAVDLTPNAHPNMPVVLSNLGIALVTRFEQLGSLEDLEAGISRNQQAVDFTLDGDPNMSTYLSNLSGALLMHFNQHGSVVDLEDAILHVRRAINLVPDSHHDKPMYLGNLGSALTTRFSLNGSLVDLEDAILQERKAINLTADDHPNMAMYISNLVRALQMRFERQGSLADLDDAILQQRKAIDLITDGHPNKSTYLCNLGTVLQARFERKSAPEDLDEAILQQRKAVNITPDGHSNKSMYLSNLGYALQMRFERLGLPVDLEDAILMQRRAVDLTPDNHPNKPVWLNNLGRVFQIRFGRHGSLADLEDAILQQRKAVNLTPDVHPNKSTYVGNLGSTLAMRFQRHGSPADLEDAILELRKAVDLTMDDNPNKSRHIGNLSSAFMTRYGRYGSRADLEDAILLQRKAVDLTPDNHTEKSRHLTDLGRALQMRFDRQGALVDLEDAILQQRKAVDLVPDEHFNKSRYLSNLGAILNTRFNRHGALTDLDEAIVQLRKAINITPNSHPARPSHLNELGNILENKFLRDGALLDLENSILQRQEAVQLFSNGHPDRGICLWNLSRVLGMRFELLGSRNDLQAALSAARESAESLTTTSALRLQSAQSWAHCCDLSSKSSLAAFQCTIKLLPRMAWLGLAVDDQYFFLAKTGSAAQDAVAAAIAEDESAAAIEWAEQGRSIVWQNLLSLRTPLDRLRDQHPQLASRLHEISQHLERPVETQSLSGELLVDEGRDRISLAMERNKLISEAKSKPGFERFMEPKSVEELASAAREGPVVVLNLGQARCDALALLSDENGAPHILAIPLEDVTLEDTEHLSGRFVELLRSCGIAPRDSRKPEMVGSIEDKNSVFMEILRTLWLNYAKPVVDALAYSVNLDSPPRLWWCTTGPLAFLPLHAAGLYDVVEVGHKLSDYVVSSYTPTITALLDRPLPSAQDEPTFLTVAMSTTPGAKPLPKTKEEVEKLQRLAANIPTLCLKNETATKERVLDGLEHSDWVHLACHGKQTGGKPMESGLLLHDGMLELSEIIKMRIPNADFAFLSACETAVGDGGIPEESAHLAAGMLFAGYRGVVATMWSIQDDIAPRVAEDVYLYLFRNGQPNSQEAAFALHRALRSLQQSGVPFASWVPFVHFGR